MINSSHIICAQLSHSAFSAWTPISLPNCFNCLLYLLSFIVCTCSVITQVMFKKLDPSEDIHGRQQIKSSVQRSIRAKLVAQFPKLESIIDEVLPKKTQLTLIKWYYWSLCLQLAWTVYLCIRLITKLYFFRSLMMNCIPVYGPSIGTLRHFLE